MTAQELNQRQADILNLLVQEYIETDHPISSLYLTQKYDLGCSSATVRSVFKHLDENGYVYAPHRSAGRIPTEKAYRYFVAHMESLPELDNQDQVMIQAEYLKHGLQLFDILETTARVLSTLTEYTTVVLGPAPDKSILKHIELIDMGQDELLVILITRSGAVYHRTVFLEDRIPGEYLRQISRRLNEKFKGMDLAEIRDQIQDISADNRYIRHYLPTIGRAIYENFEAVQGEERFFIHGLDNLFSHLSESPEGQARIQDIGGLLDSRDFLRGMFQRSLDLDSCHILIEGDRDERLQGLSLVTAGYKMGDKKVGALGVIGPNRMNYMRVVSLMEYMRHLMSNMITRITN